MNDDDDVTCVKLSLSQHATFKPGVFTNHLPGSHLRNMAASYFVSMFWKIYFMTYLKNTTDA